MSNRPRRRHRLTVDIHADTFEELTLQLEHLLSELFPGPHTSTFGGVASGGSYEHSIDENQTAERYRDEMERWLLERERK